MTFWTLFGWRIAQVLGFTLSVVGLILLSYEPLRDIDNKPVRGWVLVLGLVFIVFGLALGGTVTEYLP